MDIMENEGDKNSENKSNGQSKAINISDHKKTLENSMISVNPSTLSSSESSSTNMFKQKVLKKKIFIENIDYDAHENALKKFFTKYGQIKRCKIVRNNKTNESRGFGYVEFFNEADAARVIEAKKEELVFFDRTLNVQYFVEKNLIKPKKRFENLTLNNQSAKSDSLSQENCLEQRLQTNTFPINNLPYNVLINILSRLSIRDLCICERVCKRWYEIAHMVWSSKQKLVLNQKNVYENYKKTYNNPYGFDCKPAFTSKSLKQILRKDFATNLKELDISEYSTQLEPSTILAIANRCPNLTLLNISCLPISNNNLFSFIKHSNKLKELNISYCSNISDSSVSRVFQYCKDIENINLTFCKSIEGKCLEKSNLKLKHLVLDQLEDLKDEYLLNLFSRNKNITFLSMKRTTKFSREVIQSIINNLSKLEVLYLSGSGFDSLIGLDVDAIRFNGFRNLVKLDLSSTNGDNRLFSSILQQCINLKYFNISYCMRITDDAFTISTINSPLTELNLNFTKITDLTLQAIFQLSSTLKILNLKGTKVTSQAVSNALVKLSKLTDLDVRSNDLIDNSVLETALSLDYRSIYILCNDTRVNTIEFVYNHENTSKETLQFLNYRFKIDNLTFESGDSNLETRLDEDSYYYGSPYDSYDEFENNYDAIDRQNEEYDFFNNDEQEMYNELDEY